MNRRIPLILTIIVLSLSAIASVGGMLWESLYNDNSFVTSVWIGNDFITFFAAIPLAVFSLLLSYHRSLKGLIIWLGVLWYMIYNYIFYMYAAAFNEFFLLYVLIFILSIVAFVTLWGQMLSRDAVKKAVHHPDLPVKRVSFFMLLFSFFIGSMWIAMCISFIITKEIPIGITQTGHPTGVVFATDLSFLVTPLVIGAILLLKRNQIGYLISCIIMIKCLLYPLVLLIGGINAFRNTGFWDPFIPAYLLLGAGCFLCLHSLLKRLPSSNPDELSKR